MFTAEQYRAKAAEYASYVRTAQSPSEVREFQNLTGLSVAGGKSRMDGEQFREDDAGNGPRLE